MCRKVTFIPTHTPDATMDVPEAYEELDLYAVLNTDKSQDQNGIRKAYLRRALKTHPDKGGDKEEFNQVSFAYSILSDESRRKQYDATGKLNFAADASIADLFSQMVRVEITEDMIEEDKKLYQKSDEERRDIYANYKKFKGNFDRVFENVIHSTTDDIDRLIDVIKEGIKAKEIPKYPDFAKTTSAKHLRSRRSQASKEAKEVEESRKQLGLESEAGLAALIKSRQQKRSGFDGLIDQLEAKYAKGKNKSKKAK